MAAYGMEPTKSRYRALTPQTATNAPMLPGTTMEPPNPTASVGLPKPVAPRPAKPIDQIPEAPMRPIDQTSFRGGRQGLTPQMPVGPTNQRPGTAPRPMAPPTPPPPAIPRMPPVLPPGPITEPPNPVPAITDSGYEGNLRGNTYLPGDDERLNGAQGATDLAGKAVQDGKGYSDLALNGETRYRKLLGTGEVSAGAGVDPTGSDRYLSEQDAALEGLAGPSRTELAQQALKDFEAQGERTRDQRFRAVGQKAAALGRIGAGMTTSELGDVESNYQRDLMEKRNELARSVSEGDINDRFRRVDATSGLRRGESGIESGLRGEARTERDYTTGLGERNTDRAFDRNRTAIDYAGRDAGQDINDRYDRLNAAGSLEDRVFGQGQNNRNEFRTERGRQDTLARQSIDDRIRQRELETMDKRERLSRAIALMNAGGQVPNLDELLG